VIKIIKNEKRITVKLGGLGLIKTSATS